MTVDDVRRRRCARCRRRPGYATWDCCADGNRPRVLCWRCDVALNRLALRWMGDSKVEQKMTAYIARIEAGA